MGNQHQELESALMKYLNVPFLSLFCNGTLALQIAFQALKLKGEVITTPFTFPATVNALYQNNLEPIYCDIKFDDFNLNPEMIEELITSKTSAILPVHVFGNPCNIEQISKIAEDCNLKVVYDAAHCFGVKYKNKGIGNYGDISMFSFHATKIFHTLEGGCLTYNNQEFKKQLYLLKNFGIKNEDEVILPGTNAKMNELQAAIGLLNLKLVNEEIKKRKKIVSIYRNTLKNVEGIKYLEENEDTVSNYQYFPILINGEKFGINRDQVYENFKEYNVFSRKYFYPLCTDYKFFNNREENPIPIAKRISQRILCLPLYGELTGENVMKICDILLYLQKNLN